MPGYDPRKVWLRYAQKVYAQLVRGQEQIAELVPRYVIEQLHALGLDCREPGALVEIALDLFEQEYLEPYRLASLGREPDSKLSAHESCVIVEEMLGYPVTELFEQMKQTILEHEHQSEEQVAELLVRRFGAYPAQAILKINLKDTPIPANHVPDFALARAVTEVIAQGGHN
ncbi:MAG: hypothetical protein ABIK62_01620 [candidate division WOR-3 bacterium]